MKENKAQWGETKSVAYLETELLHYLLNHDNDDGGESSTHLFHLRKE